MTIKKVLNLLIKFAITLGIFYYLLKSGKLNFDRLILFWEHPITLFKILFILVVIIVPIATFRWWLLLRAQNIELPIGRSFLLTWIGNFFNTTLPGSVSGDVVKGFYVIKANQSSEKTKAFMTLLIDRFTGLFGLIVMAFIALLINWPLLISQPRLHPLAYAVSVLFLGIVIFYGIVFFPFKEGKDPFIKVLTILPKNKFSLKIYTTFKSYQNHKKTLLNTLLLSIVIHTSVAFVFVLITGMMGINNMEVATQMFIMPIGLITVAIPIAPGGVGVGHVAFDSLYAIVGIMGGADVFNLYIILQLAVYLMGGIVYFVYNDEY